MKENNYLNNILDLFSFLNNSDVVKGGNIYYYSEIKISCINKFNNMKYILDYFQKYKLNSIYTGEKYNQYRNDVYYNEPLVKYNDEFVYIHIEFNHVISNILIFRFSTSIIEYSKIFKKNIDNGNYKFDIENGKYNMLLNDFREISNELKAIDNYDYVKQILLSKKNKCIVINGNYIEINTKSIEYLITNVTEQFDLKFLDGVNKYLNL